MKILGIFLLLFTLFSRPTTAQIKVWMDTDIMIGMPDKEAREVDDGITLIMALKQRNMAIVGISNVTYVDYGYNMIQKILGWHHEGAAIPVYKGSPHANDLGTENDATRAMYQALRNEKITILALGPVTNVATLIQNHPDILSNIEKIVMCAARTPGLPFNPGMGHLNVFDYNYEMDTKSMDVLLSSPVPLVFAGYEPSSYTHIGKVDLLCLDQTQEADKWLYETIQPWMQLNERYFGVHGFIPFDCSTLGMITHPQYFTYYEDIPIQVNYKENDATVIQPLLKNKNFLEVSFEFKSSKKVLYARKALHGFEEKILESLSVKSY